MRRKTVAKTMAAVALAAGLLAFPSGNTNEVERMFKTTTQVFAAGYEDYVGQYVTDFSNDDAYNQTPPSYNSYYPWECVWYACGRAEEKAGHRINGIRGLRNAVNWYDATSLPTGREIRHNAIMCFGAKGGNPYGHVRFIEQVVGNKVYYTEGNVDGGISDEERSPGDGKLKVSTIAALEDASNFQGYIYLDQYINGEVSVGEDGNWRLYKDGEVNRSYTGTSYNDNGCWYIVNGEVAWDVSGIINVDGAWLYCVNGRILTDATGLAENELGWWYFKDGTIDFKYSGLVGNAYGWWKVTKGAVDFGYNGLCRNEYGNWLVYGGKVAFDVNGLACVNDKWYKFVGGAVDSTFSGLVGNELGWWKVTKGKVDFNYSGLVENELGWWKVTKGAVDFDYTGLCKNNAGNWLVYGGKVITDANGLICVNDKWYKFVNGAVDSTYNGLVENELGWWKVTNGKVDFNYSGLVENEFGTWKVKNGAVDFDYTGTYTTYQKPGKTFVIENGRVIETKDAVVR